MSELFEKEESMKLWEQDLREEEHAKGHAEGRDKERLSAIRNVMKSLQTSAGEAMRILEIPASEQACYLKKMHARRIEAYAAG